MRTQFMEQGEHKLSVRIHPAPIFKTLRLVTPVD